MNLIYDSETFVVVSYHTDEFARDGYEIVNKGTAMGMYLDGPCAEAFLHQCREWQINSPTFEEVEEYLSGLIILAQLPMRLH